MDQCPKVIVIRQDLGLQEAYTFKLKKSEKTPGKMYFLCTTLLYS